MRRVEKRVPMRECKHRALSYMRTLDNRELVKANSVAYHIWPGVEFKSQGAGAAASRILKALIKDLLVVWDSKDGDWGYRLTNMGRTRQLFTIF